MTPRIKICGIRRPDDARVAVDAGADFIGMVFAPQSKRRIDRDEAARVAEAVRQQGGSVTLVGVFVDEDPDVIRSIAAAADLDMVQFHGSETPGVVANVGLPAIRAYRVGTTLPAIEESAGAEWILYDTLVKGTQGGTGCTFDWDLLAGHPREKRFFLSGGINPENVLEAIERANPDGIDVSSGVEDAPGVKNHEKIERLIRQVKG